MAITASDIQTQVVVGMEIHVQLATRTKMFCGCRLAFAEPPNTCVCPVCLGHPGTLPVINKQAVAFAIRTGLALQCEIASFTKWDRKSYFYPDLPKNYQISQYDLPLCAKGSFEVPDADGKLHAIRIRRAHLEEDAGKNTHDVPGCTLVDLNRAGAPLLEIVTEPDLHSPEEVYNFCTQLQRLVVYLGVSEGVMQKGQMRFEPNINVIIKADGKEYKTPISEVKNLNSFKVVRAAVEYESRRQVEAWLADPEYLLGVKPNENRGWNDDRGITEFQRTKEAAHDYRYFPDPDLVPMTLTKEQIAEYRAATPQLPIARSARFVKEYALSEKDADILVDHRPTADLFEATIAAGAPKEIISKQFVNAWLKLANDRGVPVSELGVSAERMAELARITGEGLINRSASTPIAEAMVGSELSPTQLAEQMGLVQVQDRAATLAWVEEALAANDKAVKDALENPKKKQAAIGFLRGQIMKISQGKADPGLVGTLLEEKLGNL